MDDEQEIPNIIGGFYTGGMSMPYDFHAAAIERREQTFEKWRLIDEKRQGLVNKPSNNELENPKLG